MFQAFLEQPIINVVKKSGSETRLRKKAAQLLYINGDICHHIHNTIKRFFSPFNNFLERFLNGLRADFKFRTDIHEVLIDIFQLSQIPFLKNHINVFVTGGHLLMTVL